MAMSMTRTEAIRQLETLRDHCRSMIRDVYEDGIWVQDVEALDVALAALTPQNEPLSVLINDEPDRAYIDYICPKCKGTISQRRRGQKMETIYQCKYHDNCGQRVDWSNPQPYRRPPERQEDT